MAKKILVCVHYRNDEKLLLNQINKHFNFVFERVIFVNTFDKLLFGDSVNSYFEFSGYKVGTELVCEKIQDENEVLDVVYINDTIFNSHVTLLYSSYFHNLMKIKNRMKGVYGMSEVRYHGYLIPSCFFVIRASGELFSKINFHPKSSKKISNSEIDDLYYYDKDIFDNEINDWLYPKNFFRGWYKASPYEKISKDDYYRKRLAIYLECSLVSRLEGSGIPLIVQPLLVSKFLKLIDKFYCNFLKLKYRVGLFFL